MAPLVLPLEATRTLFIATYVHVDQPVLALILALTLRARVGLTLESHTQMRQCNSNYNPRRHHHPHPRRYPHSRPRHYPDSDPSPNP